MSDCKVLAVLVFFFPCVELDPVGPSARMGQLGVGRSLPQVLVTPLPDQAIQAFRGARAPPGQREILRSALTTYGSDLGVTRLGAPRDAVCGDCLVVRRACFKRGSLDSALTKEVGVCDWSLGL